MVQPHMGWNFITAARHTMVQKIFDPLIPYMGSFLVPGYLHIGSFPFGCVNLLPVLCVNLLPVLM